MISVIKLPFFPIEIMVYYIDKMKSVFKEGSTTVSLPITQSTLSMDSSTSGFS